LSAGPCDDVATLLMLYEMATAPHVREEIFCDLFGGGDVLWEAVAGVIPGMRPALDPRLYETFEALYPRAKDRD
jgi:hypothetical protein